MRFAVKVAVIVVFTKYDVLFNEHYRKVKKAGTTPSAEIRTVAEESAAADFNKYIQALQSTVPVEVEYVKVSTHNKYPRPCSSFTIKRSMELIKHCVAERFNMLTTLTTTTRKCLRDVEGDLWTPWAAAQQINAEQKVNFSIECVPYSTVSHSVTYRIVAQSAKDSKACICFLGSCRIFLTFNLEYWVNLGKSTVFQGKVLWDCVSRIHRDILAVWNFHDPLKVRLPFNPL